MHFSVNLIIYIFKADHGRNAILELHGLTWLSLNDVKAIAI